MSSTPIKLRAIVLSRNILDIFSPNPLTAPIIYTARVPKSDQVLVSPLTMA
jgi:hypothetical protein